MESCDLHFVQGLTEDHIGRWTAVTPPREEEGTAETPGYV